MPKVIENLRETLLAASRTLLLEEGYRQKVAQAVAAGVLAWKSLEIEKPEPLPAVDRSHEPHDET